MASSNNLQNNKDWSDLDSFILSGNYSSIFVLADSNTAELCWPALINNCDFAKEAEIIEVPAGEESKSLEIAAQIWSAMLEIGADRNSLIINLGGGMICDLGAFIASLYMRGIEFIHIPTSLLAQVDAAIGGKNGIDFNNFKNAIGTFNQAKAIFIFPGLLETLPHRQLRSGLAEMIKHGLLDADHWNLIRSVDFKGIEDFMKLAPVSAEQKMKVVLQDPLEKGLRKSLNLGHTFGHGMESAALNNQIDLLHGEAVAAGLFAEVVLAAQLSILSEEHFNEITDVLLQNFELKAQFDLDFEEVWSFMLKDKKNRSGVVRMVLLESPGKVILDQSINEDDAKKAWDEARSIIV